jgi:GT2 family glycosyltransferase
MSNNAAILWRREDAPRTPRLGAGPPRVAVAIPVHNEADLICATLRALSEQRNAPPFTVILLLNNCTDGTAEAVSAAATELSFPIVAYDITLAPELSNAAWARRLVTNAACEFAGAEGYVLTTDADSRVDATWIATHVRRFEEGLDVVCGFVTPDLADGPMPSFEMIMRGAMEFEYSQLMAELHALVDPDPCDPWPTHIVETGANLGVRARVLATLGGIPHVCPGEDRAFVEIARRKGYLIKHEFSTNVVTSSRIRGRAEGGWSADLAARSTNERDACHERLEPAQLTYRRARMRRRLRVAHGTPALPRLVSRLVRNNFALTRICQAASFEEAWGMLVEAFPALAGRVMYAEELQPNIELMRAWVLALRERGAAAPAKAPQAPDAKYGS